jgi:hypothetical protein
MDFSPEHITTIDALIAEREGDFLVKTHEIIDIIINNTSTSVQLSSNTHSHQK